MGSQVSRILAAADRYVGIPYGTPASRHDLTRINCSTLTAHVLDDAVVLGGLSTAAWLDVVVGDGRRPWSPIERAVVDGWGEAVPDDAAGPTWDGVYLLQGWRTIPTHGHAMLVWASQGRLAVLEATNLRGPDGMAYGVRWRGAPRSATSPLDLADAPRTTSELLAASYPAGVKWARLRGA